MTDKDRVVRILTLLLTLGWIVSLVVRIYIPTWPLGPAVDSLEISVVGYWFSREGLKKGTTP